MDMQKKDTMPRKEWRRKTVLILAALAIILAAALFLWAAGPSSPNPAAPTNEMGAATSTPPVSAETVTTTANTTNQPVASSTEAPKAAGKDMNGFNTTDLQDEFNQINTNVNQY